MNISFVAYQLGSHQLELVPAHRRRAWMDETPGRYASRCLPLLVANQSGWVLLNAVRVSATWHGGRLPGDCTIESDGPGEPPVAHFGSGIVTWRIPYLFRTPPGWNLLMRGPANLPKDGTTSLEGVIETDWATQPAFHSWKLTREGHRVTWDQGEPICMVVPVKRGELESWHPVTRDIGDDPALAAEFQTFSESRRSFNRDQLAQWQKHYLQGASPGLARAPNGQHQMKLDLKPFTADPGTQ